MASLRQFPGSKFYYACFTAPDGRRVQKSTKQSDRRKAQAVAEAFEKVAKLGSEKRLGEAQARKVLNEIYEAVSGETLQFETTKAFLTRWAEARKADTSPRTAAAYAQVARDFAESLGNRAEFDLAQVAPADVVRFRSGIMQRTSVANARKSVKILSVALRQACREGLIQVNPATNITPLKESISNEKARRPFSVPELRKVIENATGEWRGIVLLGIYTGQRLRDICRLSWANVDLERETLTFRTSKTGRSMELPLAAPLLAHLQAMPSADTPSAPLFPEAFALANRPMSDSRLSQQFHAILEAAGLATPQPKTGKGDSGDGRASRRKVSALSFHSLRHSVTSLLKNAGVNEAVAGDLIGHESKAVSRNYTKISLESKRAAVDKLPNLL